MQKRLLIFLGCFLPAFLSIYVLSDGIWGPGTEKLAIHHISHRAGPPLKIQFSRDSRVIYLYPDQKIRKFYYAYYERQTGLQQATFTAASGSAQDGHTFLLEAPQVRIRMIDKSRRCYTGVVLTIVARKAEVVLQERELTQINLIDQVVLTYHKKGAPDNQGRLTTDYLSASLPRQMAWTEHAFKLQWANGLTLIAEGLRTDRDLAEFTSQRNNRLAFNGQLPSKGKTTKGPKRRPYPALRASSSGPLKLRYDQHHRHVQIDMHQGVVLTSRAASLTTDHLQLLLVPQKRKATKRQTRSHKGKGAKSHVRKAKRAKPHVRKAKRAKPHVRARKVHAWPGKGKNSLNHLWLRRIQAQGQVHFQDGVNESRCERYYWQRGQNGSERIILQGRPRIWVRNPKQWSLMTPREQAKLAKRKLRLRCLTASCAQKMIITRQPRGEDFQEQIVMQERVQVHYQPVKGNPVTLQARQATLWLREQVQQGRRVRRPLRFVAVGQVVIQEKRLQAHGARLQWQALGVNKSRTILQGQPYLKILQVPVGRSFKQWRQKHLTPKKPRAQASRSGGQRADQSAQRPKPSGQHHKTRRKRPQPRRKGAAPREDLEITCQAPMQMELEDLAGQRKEFSFTGDEQVCLRRLRQGKELGRFQAQHITLRARQTAAPPRARQSAAMAETRASWELQYLLATGQATYQGPEGHGQAQKMEYRDASKTFTCTQKVRFANQDGWVQGQYLQYDQSRNILTITGRPAFLGQGRNTAQGDKIVYYRTQQYAILSGRPALVKIYDQPTKQRRTAVPASRAAVAPATQQRPHQRRAASGPPSCTPRALKKNKMQVVIRAPQIRYNLAKEQAQAQGGVEVRFKSDDQGTGGAQALVAHYYRQQEKIILTGRPAIVWQQARAPGAQRDEVRAQRIVFERATGEAQAQGKVTMIFTPGAGRKLGFLPQRLQKRLQAKTRQRASRTPYHLNADQAQVSFDLKQHRLHRFEARGHLKISHASNQQQALGNRLTYDAQHKIARLYGQPAHLAQEKIWLESPLVEIFQAKEEVKCHGPVVLSLPANSMRQTRGRAKSGQPAPAQRASNASQKQAGSVSTDRPGAVNERMGKGQDTAQARTKGARSHNHDPQGVGLRPNSHKAQAPAPRHKTAAASASQSRNPLAAMGIGGRKFKFKKIIIKCQGSVQIKNKERRATFEQNVVIKAGNVTIHCQLLKAILAPRQNEIQKLIAHRQVVIIADEQQAWGDQLIWDEKRQKATLRGSQACLLSTNFKMWADQVLYDIKSKSFRATGNLYFEKLPELLPDKPPK